MTRSCDESQRRINRYFVDGNSMITTEILQGAVINILSFSILPRGEFYKFSESY